MFNIGVRRFANLDADQENPHFSQGLFMDTIAALRETELFSSISASSLAALADICLTKKVRKKEILFMEGEPGLSIYILISGYIRLYTTSEDGQEVSIKTVKPGELFAEVILFEEDTYPVTATALEDCDLLMLPKHQFNCILENAAFRSDFLQNLMKKLRFLTRQIRVLSKASIEDRFFAYLEEMHGRQRTIHCRLSKKDVAASIGATPESLSRLLASLKERDLCTWENHIITVDRSVWKNRPHL
jgi:CRP/FNR family transcriptional regulator